MTRCKNHTDFFRRVARPIFCFSPDGQPDFVDFQLGRNFVFRLDSNCWQAQYRVLVLRRIYDWSTDSWRERKQVTSFKPRLATD